MLFLASLVVSSTAVLGSGMPIEEAARAAGCGASLECVPPVDVVAALADAQSVGLECASHDGACWQRVLAVAGFDAFLVVERNEDGFAALWVEPSAVRTGMSTTSEGAARAVSRARAAEVAAASSPAEPRAPRAPNDAQPIRIYGFIGAAVGASVALVGAGAATAVSVSLAKDLDDAYAGRAVLEDYDLRNNLFIALGIASMIGGAVAGGGLWVALREGE